MQRLPILLAIALIVASCGNNNNNNSQAQQPLQPVPFPFPKAPAMVTSQDQQAQWGSIHFWDAFFALKRGNSKDSTIIGGVKKDDIAQAFASYAALLDYIPLNEIPKALDSLISKAERASNPLLWSTLTQLCDQYLYDANSPYRSEEIYLHYMQRALASPLLGEGEKARYEHELPRCSLNRIGEKATDFHFTQYNGRSGTLHGIKAARTVLFLSNPGCPSCKEIMEAFNSSLRVQELIESKKVVVLNLYPDEDLTAWYDYLENYPKTWINAFDSEGVFKEYEYYNLRAIPSLYLLGPEKEVILKDAPLEKMLHYLTNLEIK